MTLHIDKGNVEPNSGYYCHYDACYDLVAAAPVSIWRPPNAKNLLCDILYVTGGRKGEARTTLKDRRNNRKIQDRNIITIDKVKKEKILNRERV